MREEKRWPYKMRRLMLMLFLVFGIVWENDHVVPGTGNQGCLREARKELLESSARQRKGWIYLYEDGTQAKGRSAVYRWKTYYFSEDGIRQYGWQKIDGKWYYFGSKSKAICTKNTWVKENGKRTYYLLSDGSRCQGGTAGEKYILF